MLSFIRSGRARKAMAAALAATFVLSVAGCGQKQQQGGNKAALVKTMKVIKRDTPLVYDYTGFVQAQQEMELKAQVSGQITAKYFKGGDNVVQARPCMLLTSVLIRPTCLMRRQAWLMPVRLWLTQL